MRVEYLVKSCKNVFAGPTGDEDVMFNSKKLFEVSYKCRLCSACFYNPEELRIHSMANHKGHMLIIKR